MALYPLLRPLVFALDAERAHRLTIAALKAVPPGRPPVRDAVLATTLAGIEFPNPVGLAAGFDKDSEIFAQMLGFGFGFVEVGTVTPLPQAGNPRPRLYRLADQRGVINRMGFNNRGQAAALARLENRDRRGGIVGVNIGANKENAAGDAAIADYVAGFRAMRSVADYVTINISSPNTPGLRALQDEGALDALLAAVMAQRGEGPPVFLKVSPDLYHSQIESVVRSAIRHRLDALIVCNTTTRTKYLWAGRDYERGGISGAPLKGTALARLIDFRSVTGGQIKLIAAGGVENGADAYARIRAGASLVQLYTALVYQGPGLARRIAGELRLLLRRDGFTSLSEAVGTSTPRSPA